MSWIYLLFAIAFEVGGTTCMKLSDGFKEWLPSVAMVPLYLLSFACLTLVLKTIEVSVAYAVWSGIGTAAIAVIGVWYFDEELSPLKVVSLLLVIIGVIGLNLSGPKH